MFGMDQPLLKILNEIRLREHAMVFMNPNASQDEIVKSGEEVIASLYGSITYEGLDLLICRIFTRKVSASPYLAPTSAASSYHDKRAYLQLQEKIWTENFFHLSDSSNKM